MKNKQINKEDVEKINEIDKLEEETKLAEFELLVKHNKNLSKDLRKYLKCKRKLASFIKETDL